MQKNRILVLDDQLTLSLPSLAGRDPKRDAEPMAEGVEDEPTSAITSAAATLATLTSSGDWL